VEVADAGYSQQSPRQFGLALDACHSVPARQTGKAMENMANEEGEIGSAIGGKTEGQPYHAYALPKKDRLRLAYSVVVYGCNGDGLEG
jgi:hypothetical protein